MLPGPDGSFGDTVLFVGANVLSLERKFEFRRKWAESEFRHASLHTAE